MSELHDINKNISETAVLSPREISALLLANQIPCQIDRRHVGLASLLSRDLVRVEGASQRYPQVSITPDGLAILAALRGSASERWTDILEDPCSVLPESERKRAYL